MKVLSLAILLCLFSNQVKAQAVSQELTGFTFVPTAITKLYKLCQTGDMFACMGVILLSPLSTMSAMGVITLIDYADKEEVKNLRADSHLFLAGENMTEALEEQLQLVRNDVPELDTYTDEEVVGILLQLSYVESK